METANEHSTPRSRAILAAALGLCLLAGLIITASPDHAASAPLRVVVLGKTASPPPASCPGEYRLEPQANGTTASKQVVACVTEGHVTGFQVSADGVNQPVKAPYDGKIVSWSITLGKPSPKSTQKHPDANGLFEVNELSFFNDLLGTPASARIGILRPIENAKVKTFKMVRQSPTQVLNPYFGTTVQFVLDHPLTILKDQMVALTVPTWAPMFSPAGTSGDVWRGSRVSPNCSSKPSIVNGHPQQKVGSKKVYTCVYQGARLLYTATLIKQPGS